VTAPRDKSAPYNRFLLIWIIQYSWALFEIFLNCYTMFRGLTCNVGRGGGGVILSSGHQKMHSNQTFLETRERAWTSWYRACLRSCRSTVPILAAPKMCKALWCRCFWAVKLEDCSTKVNLKLVLPMVYPLKGRGCGSRVNLRGITNFSPTQGEN
jgi:hypothetical protein